MKPRVMSLVIFTCAVGFLTSNSNTNIIDAMIGIILVALGAGAAGARGWRLARCWSAVISMRTTVALTLKTMAPAFQRKTGRKCLLRLPDWTTAVPEPPAATAWVCLLFAGFSTGTEGTPSSAGATRLAVQNSAWSGPEKNRWTPLCEPDPIASPDVTKQLHKHY